MKKNFHLILLLLPISCLGHMDPSGEIYPSVFVIDGKFHILFADRIPEKENSEVPRHGVFKKIYSENGKIQECKSQLKTDEGLEHYKKPKLKAKDEVQSCPNMKKESYFVFPIPDNRSTTFYLTASDGHRKVLDWGTVAVDLVGGFAVTADSIIIVATVEKEKVRNKRYVGTDLWMFHFDRSNGNMLFSQKVGDPTFIYSFPGVSNVIGDSGKVYFVWNQQTKEEGKEILHLIRYDIAKREYYDIPLPYESTWNIKISLGMNKQMICLAYHGIGPEVAVEFIPIKATNEKRVEPPN